MGLANGLCGERAGTFARDATYRNPHPPAEQKWSHPEADGLSFREAIGTVTFWRLGEAVLFNYLAAAAGSNSLPVILADRGASASQAALAISVVDVSPTTSPQKSHAGRINELIAG